jgi:hypothetical protein
MMPGFRGLWEINESYGLGKSYYSFWRKTPSQTTVAGQWFDTSMSPGNPAPQYYAASPLVAQQMKRSTDGGIPHGTNVSSASKYLSRFLIMSASATGLPMPYILCDYLLYYPFVDTGSNDEQLMTNIQTLPRFTDGVGVQIMAVSVAASGGLQPTFTVNYTNSAGVAGRTSQLHTLSTNTFNGAIMSNNQLTTVSTMPFIGLQSGDSGVRSIESVTFITGTDVGLLSFVLVKPLMTGVILEQTAPSEKVCQPNDGVMPQIYDDAFLGLLTLPNGSLSGVAFHGEIETIWN